VDVISATGVARYGVLMENINAIVVRFFIPLF
jgi:hypothetical protein